MTKTEGLFLVEIKESKSGKEIIKNIQDVEIPDSIPELFAKEKEIVAKLGARIQQIYYTVGRVDTSKGGRVGLTQSAYLLDIDYVDQERKDDYIKIVCDYFEVDPAKVGIVDSGYGLQFIFAFKTPAKKEDFDATGDAFQQSKRIIEGRFRDAGLLKNFETHKGTVSTHVDTSVHRLASLARMPGTVNHAEKKNREARTARAINATIQPVAESLTALFKTQSKPEAKAENKTTVKILPAETDGEYVLQNCGLLKWALVSPHEIHEKDFFFVVGILKHCGKTEQEGEDLCLKWFREVQKKSPSPTLQSYTEDRALEKIIRAEPATYKKLEAHFGREMFANDPDRAQNAHPLQMHSKTFIVERAKANGFHKITLTKSGNVIKEPDYESLRVFFEEQFPYNSCNEKCWVFNGKFFYKYEDDFLKNFAQTHFNPIADTRMVNEFCNLVLRTNLVSPEFWDNASQGHMNFDNGVLCLKDRGFVPHEANKTMRYKFRAVLPYAYDPQATAPNFEKFISDVTMGEKEHIQNLLEFFGYAISGDQNWLAQTLLLYGPEGGNGKSTTLEILKEVVGQGFYSSISFDDLANDQKCALLEGKLFNVFDESESSKFLQSKVWKNLTTGGEITVKTIFEKPYTIKNRAKMLFATNHMPKSNDTSKAFFRRWLVIPFERNFIEEGISDPFILDRLRSELPGIVNLLISAYSNLKLRRHFEIGTASEKMVRAFTVGVDPIALWMDEEIEDLYATRKIPETDERWKKEIFNMWQPTSKLFAEFEKFCELENLTMQAKMITHKAFVQRFEQLLKKAPNGRKDRRQDEKLRGRGFWGIGEKKDGWVD